MAEQPKNHTHQSVQSSDGKGRVSSATPVVNVLTALTPGADNEARDALAKKIVSRAEALSDGGKAAVSIRILRGDDGALHAQIGSSVDGKATEPLSTIQLTGTKKS